MVNLFLKGVNILSNDLMRQFFDIKELFLNADRGTLLDYERNTARKDAISKAICELMERTESANGLLANGEFSKERLDETLFKIKTKRCYSITPVSKI